MSCSIFKDGENEVYIRVYDESGNTESCTIDIDEFLSEVKDVLKEFGYEVVKKKK